MDFGRKIITWYHRSPGLWAAVYQNADGDQIGFAGYGPSKQSAIGDLAYQNSIPQPYRSAVGDDANTGD